MTELYLHVETLRYGPDGRPWYAIVCPPTPQLKTHWLLINGKGTRKISGRVDGDVYDGLRVAREMFEGLTQ